jgi:hypothetical protein
MKFSELLSIDWCDTVEIDFAAATEVKKFPPKRK